MEVLKKIWSYLTFQKSEGEGSFIKSMHIMNKISIVLFIIGLIYIVYKFS